MVYESDFYTTRRPYRASPSYSSYTSSFEPSRQVRILPGLGKVHIVHSYDRIVPYVGHKRLTVVSHAPKVFSTRPSILQREYDWIEHKVRPRIGYSATNRYLNSDSAVRIYYSSYPIGSSYYTTVSLPSSPYYPKTYRWYYDFPRTYTTRYYPSSYYNYWPTRYYSDLSSSLSYYWPRYRSYLSSFFRNYYLSSLPSLYYKSLDYEFNELENKIDNLSRMIYISPIRGVDYLYYPESTRYYRPLTLYYNYYWPLRSLNYYSDVWPYYPYYRYLYYKYTLPSDRYYHLKGIFDDETRLIRAETSSLLRRIHDPVPRARLSWPAATTIRYIGDGLPARYSSNNYIHKMLTTSPLNQKVQYTTYYTEPVRKYIGTGGLSCVSYAGERAYNSRRPYIYLYENPLQSDIQLMSYYINKFKQEKAAGGAEAKLALSPARPSRKFGAKSAAAEDAEAAEEMRQHREARAARLAFINDEERESRVKPSSYDVDDALRAKKEKEQARLAEEKELAEEQSRREILAKEAARKAELARQEELAAKAAAERAADLEKQAESARQEERKRQAEIERIKREEQERQLQEEQKRLEDEAKADEERKQLERLEELARQAEEDKEAELARQADELAELARQEAELAEQEKQLAEEEERKRQEAELEDLARQEAELAELERQEKELQEQAKAETEVAERAKEDAESTRREAEQAELEAQQAELEELEKQQAELDAMESVLESDLVQHKDEEETPEEEEELQPEVYEPIEEMDQAQADLIKQRAQEEFESLEAEAKAMESDSEYPTEEELAKRKEAEEWARARAELEDLERAQVELDALEAEAKEMEAELGPPSAEQNGDYEDDRAIAEDVPGEQSDEEEA